MTVVGDIMIPRLVVAGYDADTVATVRLVDPDYAAVPLPVQSGDGGQTWTGQPLQFGAEGEWQLRWHVTGSGGGDVVEIVEVLPASGYVASGFSYANSGDLIRYSGEELPSDARRKLIAASREIARLTRNARYDTTLSGHAVDPQLRQALADATCELVGWWESTGSQSGARAVYQSVSIGGISLAGFGGGAGGDLNAARIGPQVHTILDDAGLLGWGPRSDG